jgi:hypothetical protein
LAVAEVEGLSAKAVVVELEDIELLLEVFLEGVVIQNPR